MSNKYTTETFIEKAKEIHGDKYDYSKVDYINSKTKINILCKIHGEFQQRPVGHLSGKGCKDCGLIKNKYNRKSNSYLFIKKAKEIHGDKYDYSKVKYEKNNTKVIIICKEHGEFLQTPNCHLDGNGCNKCAIKSSSEKRKFTNDIFIEKAIKIHGNKYDYSKVEYKNANSNIIILCKFHGEFLQRASSHINRNAGCPKCSGNYRYTTESFIEKAKKIHGNKYDYSKVDYKSSKEKIVIVCKIHGVFEQSPCIHLKSHGCKKCAYIEGGNKQSSNAGDNFIIKAKEIHGDKYDYSKVKYEKNNTKVIIICKEHGDFLQNPNSHLNGSGCIKCSGNYRYTTEDFIIKAKEIHGDKYDYSCTNYLDCNNYVSIICREHGEFLQNPTGHLSGKGCKKCSGNYKSTTEEFIIKAKKIHGDKYDYSKVDYKSSKEKIVIVCKIHGVFEQSPCSHLNGSGCIRCSYIRYSNNLFIKKAKEIHGDKYDYSKLDYEKNNEKVIIICKKHGEFLQRASSHIRGQGCRKCNGIKYYSKKQIDWLNFISIYYNLDIQHAENNSEYTINNSSKKADGYCKENNTIYEFHGDYWHGNPKIYDKDNITHLGKTSGELFDRTIKKEEFIKKQGYNLVVMWENDWKKINKSIKILQNNIKLKFL